MTMYRLRLDALPEWPGTAPAESVVSGQFLLHHTLVRGDPWADLSRELHLRVDQMVEAMRRADHTQRLRGLRADSVTLDEGRLTQAERISLMASLAPLGVPTPPRQAPSLHRCW